MDNRVAVFDFSGVYEYESFYRSDKGSSFVYDILSCRDIQGTNCMCDDAAVAAIRKLIEKNGIPAGGVHFIDNGNYHYMSSILTGFVQEPFSLVVLDHHPDMQPPMFGGILSCGGWVLDVMENNEFVRDIHIIGADKALIEQLDEDDRKRVHFYDADETDKVVTEYPVFLSIDKDVVSRDELVTNWDQGEMTTDGLIDFVKRLCEGRKIIGVDICGECAPDQEGIDFDREVERNDRLNQRLMDVLKYCASVRRAVLQH